MLWMNFKFNSHDRVSLCHAIPGHTAVAIAIMRHIRYPMAWHVSRQSLVRRNTGKTGKKKNCYEGAEMILLS